MYKEHLKYLACPQCQSELVVLESHPLDRNIARPIENPEIITEGIIGCSNRHAFKVTQGIPRLLPPNLSAAEAYVKSAFDYQWTQYGFKENSGNREEFYRKTGYKNHSKSMAGKVWLEAGVGSGRFMKIIMEDYQPKLYIGIDFSKTVDRLIAELGDRKDILFVQADIMNLPIKEETVDIAQSIGVLHHTANPFHGFSKICKTLKENGLIQIKVYKRQPFYSHYPLILMLKLFSSLSQRLRIFLLKAVVSFLYPFQTVINQCFGSKYGHFRKLDKEEFFTLVHDLLSTKITCFYEEKEIEDWFIKEKITILSRATCPISFLGNKEQK